MISRSRVSADGIGWAEALRIERGDGAGDGPVSALARDAEPVRAPTSGILAGRCYQNGRLLGQGALRRWPVRDGSSALPTVAGIW